MDGISDKNKDRDAITQRTPAASPTQHLKAKFAHQAGVGIIFQKQTTPDPRGLVVERCSAGGPAENSRRIHHGMVLVAIDDTDIRGLAAAHIAPLIIGPLGSEVQLTFQDHGEGHDGEHRVVKLTRGVVLK
eukprot:CAMPEP_0196742640 /NCGR_PEP_ID=MMETSP1091-20130531/48124_1 /TAXON_ID=302021 /ORGANISM="Rhodomonas sp., Strain CCMP768" /LENGTH=130 /DNA_ID=CAMNT_0042088755 /DNA_START=237 /DNA_END=629 /DNA_ORIENTATION=+